MVKLDDVVGAIPAHLFAGVWGTIAVAIFGSGDILAQLAGVASIGAFVFLASLAIWKVLSLTIGARVSRDVEQIGQDSGELGMEAYPEFVLMPENFDE